jgi:hypothetical protein
MDKLIKNLTRTSLPIIKFIDIIEEKKINNNDSEKLKKHKSYIEACKKAFDSLALRDKLYR